MNDKKQGIMNFLFRAWCIGLIIIVSRITAASGAGTQFPSEKMTFPDAKTGLQITALTRAPGVDNKLYQTHPSWLADGKHIVFVSDRAGSSQLFAVNEETGVITQLTQGSPVGHAYLGRRANEMYLFQDQQVKRIDAGAVLAGRVRGEVQSATAYETVIAAFPGDLEVRDVPSVDADGQWLYTSGRDRKTDEWFLLKLNLATGEWTRFLKTPFMTGHVQANPVVPGLVMYCHETGGDAPQRLWVTRSDGSGNMPFYQETPDEWVTHETWWGMDRALFNISEETAKMGNQPFGVASVRYPDREAVMHYRGPNWHVCGTPDQRYAVVDTFQGELILIDIALVQTRLLTQGHRPQKNIHTHQSISPDGRRVLFASGYFGNYDLMTVEIPVWEELTIQP
ncbi:MAG: oligogalacturonate lyase family protein [bacterium]